MCRRTREPTGARHVGVAGVSLGARRHGIAPNQLFAWRRLCTERALSAVGLGEEVVAASEYRAFAAGP